MTGSTQERGESGRGPGEDRRPALSRPDAPIERILALVPPEDRAERAVGVAGRLAERFGADLVLLRVLESDLGQGKHAHLRQLVVDAEKRTLEQIAQRHAHGSVRVRTELVWGVPWEKVLDQVGALQVDLVVKPAHGLTHAGRVFFGSTALHLFRKCPCPVWVVGDEGTLPRRLLAAVDPAPDPGRRAVGECVLGTAGRVARSIGASLDIVSAWDAPGEAVLRDRLPKEELEGYAADCFARAEASLSEIVRASPLSLPWERIHLVPGAAREAIPRFAETGDYDLVVMGTVGRTGVAGELLGESAEMVLRQIHGSVLTLPAPGLG